jgi:5-hydroxyisourate hydrolase
MAGITTHILDLAKGRPAAGIQLTLRIGDRVVFEGVTDKDGRARLVEAGDVESETYHLTFHTNGDFFPEATITFKIEDKTQHYHVPLLLSPYGYSTYRGS